MRASNMGIRRPVTRSGLFLEHVIWTTLGTVGWNVYSGYGIDGWKLFPFVYFWLSLPLLVILVSGWLLRFKCHVAISWVLETDAVRTWRLSSWVVVGAVLGAGTASMVDVLFVWAEDLGSSSDWHWLLFPWGMMGAA